MSHVQESRAGSDGRLVPVASTREPQTLLSGRQLTAETVGLTKPAMALQPPVTQVPWQWHIYMGTPPMCPEEPPARPRDPSAAGGTLCQLSHPWPKLLEVASR